MKSSSIPQLFPQNEQGLSLDVLLSRAKMPDLLTMRVHKYDRTRTPIPLGETSGDTCRIIQSTLNRFPLHLPEPVREVWFHNDNEKEFSLPMRLYQETLFYLKAAQVDTNPEGYRIDFGQSRIPIVRGNSAMNIEVFLCTLSQNVASDICVDHALIGCFGVGGGNLNLTLKNGSEAISRGLKRYLECTVEDPGLPPVKEVRLHNGSKCDVEEYDGSNDKVLTRKLPGDIYSKVISLLGSPPLILSGEQPKIVS